MTRIFLKTFTALFMGAYLLTAATGPAPLIIRDVDNPARQAWTYDSLGNMSNGDFIGSTSTYTVPAGKRLVVESISARAEASTGQQFYAFIKTDSSGGAYFGFSFVTPEGGGQSVSIANPTVKMYISAGDRFAPTVYRSATAGTANFHVLAAGYLVDVP